MPRKKNNTPKSTAPAPETVAEPVLDVLGLDASASDTTEQDPILEATPAVPSRPNKNLWERRKAEESYEDARRVEQSSRMVSYKYTSAMYRGAIMQSRIAAVLNAEKTAYWVCYDENVLIKIPCAETFENLTDNLLADGNVELKHGFLERCVGATIEYVVTNVDYNEDDDVYTVIGSRIKALQKIRRRYFGPTAEKAVRVGDLVTCQIISAGNYACHVNFYGVDTRIQNKDLTYRYVPNVASAYPPGTKLNAQIVAIEGADNKPEVILSGLRAEKESFGFRKYRVQPNMTTTATVKTFRLNTDTNPPSLTISLYLDDVELPGFSNTVQLSFRDKLHSGSKVCVKVQRIMESTGFIQCQITRILKDEINLM